MIIRLTTSPMKSWKTGSSLVVKINLSTRVFRTTVQQYVRMKGRGLGVWHYKLLYHGMQDGFEITNSREPSKFGRKNTWDLALLCVTFEFWFCSRFCWSALFLVLPNSTQKNSNESCHAKGLETQHIPTR